MDTGKLVGWALFAGILALVSHSQRDSDNQAVVAGSQPAQPHEAAAPAQPARPMEAESIRLGAAPSEL